MKLFVLKQLIAIVRLCTSQSKNTTMLFGKITEITKLTEIFENGLFLLYFLHIVY